ncbi:MAG: hypothetical protein EXR48_00220 [Dehalococcoidia bacterium]|nr:hypothetical protein [Dehalococcoidia bacterium]
MKPTKDVVKRILKLESRWEIETWWDTMVRQFKENFQVISLIVGLLVYIGLMAWVAGLDVAVGLSLGLFIAGGAAAGDTPVRRWCVGIVMAGLVFIVFLSVRGIG